MNEIKELSPLDELRCPKCATDINALADIQNPQPVTKGNIVICGQCATICKVGDLNLLVMTKKEVQALDPQSKYLVGVAVSSVLAKRLNDKGKG